MRTRQACKDVKHHITHLVSVYRSKLSFSITSHYTWHVDIEWVLHHADNWHIYTQGMSSAAFRTVRPTDWTFRVHVSSLQQTEVLWSTGERIHLLGRRTDPSGGVAASLAECILLKHSLQVSLHLHHFALLRRSVIIRRMPRFIPLSSSKVKVMLRLWVSQSECLGVKSTQKLVTRYYFLSQICCVVSVGRPLWREVGSVSLSVTVSSIVIVKI
jgi:hypothetical protein